MVRMTAMVEILKLIWFVSCVIIDESQIETKDELNVDPMI